MDQLIIISKQTPNNLPRVIAVILNYNGYEDTVKCIYSLQNVTYNNLNLIIVDNGSTDGSGNKLKNKFPNLTIIALEKNTGYAAGNNVGIRFAMGQGADYVLILNNDVVVDSHFLEPLIEVAESSNGIGVVTPKIFYEQESSGIFYAAGELNKWLCTGVNYPGKFRNNPNEHIICDVSYVSGCVMLVRHVVFETLGLFDEKFFMYFEDVEFSRRLAKQYRLVYTPFSLTYHRCGAGKKWHSYSKLYLYYHTRNRIWTFKSEAYYYRIYVVLFTIMITIAKSIAVFRCFIKNPKDTFKRVIALWRGLRDGLFYCNIIISLN
jgi:GT2 family glycosyltransferase